MRIWQCIKGLLKRNKYIYAVLRKVKYTYLWVRWEVVRPLRDKILNRLLRIKGFCFRCPVVRRTLQKIKYWIKEKLVETFRYKKYKIVSSEYAERKGWCVQKTIEPGQRRPVHVGEFYERREAEQRGFLSPEIKVSVYRDVEIIGGASFLLHGQNMVYDIAVLKKKTIDLVGPVVKWVRGNGTAAITYTDEGDSIEEGICMFGLASYNYYHFSVEILSRLAYVDRFPKMRGLPIIVDGIVSTVPNMMKLLETVNQYGHPVIFIKNTCLYRVRRLIYPSYNTWMPINVKDRILAPDDYLIAKSAVENLREAVLAGVENMPFRKIYLSRMNMGNVRLKNEKTVRDLFEKYGFEIVYPERLSFVEQVRIFSEARYVAGAVGGAMTNLVYCSPGSQLICILPEEFKFHLYSTLAYLVGMKVVNLDARITEYTDYISTDSYELDVKYAERLLKTL